MPEIYRPGERKGFVRQFIGDLWRIYEEIVFLGGIYPDSGDFSGDFMAFC